MEDELHNAFLLALFKRDMSQIPGREVTGLSGNQDGIALPYPTQTAVSN